MSISIATLGMFNPNLGMKLEPPLKLNIGDTSIICKCQKSDVTASLSATKITAKVKNTKLSINLNKDELKLIVKET